MFFKLFHFGSVFDINCEYFALGVSDKELPFAMVERDGGEIEGGELTMDSLERAGLGIP